MTTLGMTVTLGGEQMLITDLRVIDKQWVSGDRRFTPKEKELLTKQARAIIAEHAPLPAPPELALSDGIRTRRSIQQTQVMAVGGPHDVFLSPGGGYSSGPLRYPNTGDVPEAVY